MKRGRRGHLTSGGFPVPLTPVMLNLSTSTPTPAPHRRGHPVLFCIFVGIYVYSLLWLLTGASWIKRGKSIYVPAAAGLKVIGDETVSIRPCPTLVTDEYMFPKYSLVPELSLLLCTPSDLPYLGAASTRLLHVFPSAVLPTTPEGPPPSLIWTCPHVQDVGRFFPRPRTITLSPSVAYV